MAKNISTNYTELVERLGSDSTFEINLESATGHGSADLFLLKKLVVERSFGILTINDLAVDGPPIAVVGSGSLTEVDTEKTFVSGEQLFIRDTASPRGIMSLGVLRSLAVKSFVQKP